MRTANVALIGTGFVGKVHSTAFAAAPKFFEFGIKPVMKVACDVNQPEVFAKNWGWEESETDWRKVVERKDIDIVDVCVPTYLHKEVVLAAAQNGKQIFCEKPIALSYAESIEMYEAAEKAGVLHYLNHNYRRTPAVAYAKQLIDDGRIGRIYHWRGVYFQDWIMDPNFPLTWHLQKKYAGAGPHYDLNSHSLDLARFLVGEVRSVTAMTTNFVRERPLPGKDAGTFVSGAATSTEKGEVTVEDASFMITEFENGALGSFNASRFGSGRKNFNCFEIYGDKGAVAFNFERMNELQFLDLTDNKDEQGFRTFLVGNATHPYMKAWWPAGHMIGYEHLFSHAVYDFMKAMETGTKIVPNLEDGVKGMQVLEAALKSAKTGLRVVVADIQ